MKHIGTFKDLAELKDKVRSVNAGIKLKAQYGFWDGKAECTRKEEALLAANNQAYKALPESLEISPELGFFLSQNIESFKKQEAELEQSQKPLTRIALMTLTHIGAVVFPSPHSFINAIGSTKKTFDTLAQYGRQAKALQESQDVISIAVLSAYLLQEKEPGKFILTRGSWQKTKHSVFNGRSSDEYVIMRPYNTSLDCVRRPDTLNYYQNDYAEAACGYGGLSEPVQKIDASQGKS